MKTYLVVNALGQKGLGLDRCEVAERTLDDAKLIYVGLTRPDWLTSHQFGASWLQFEL